MIAGLGRRPTPAATSAPGSAPTDVALRLVGLTVRLGRRTVVDGVDLQVETGSWTSIIGPNGAGKTSLLRAVAGLAPSTGTIELAGRDGRALGPRPRARLVALVPQQPLVPPGVTVVDYVVLGRTPHLGLGLNAGRHDLEIVAGVLADLGLTAFARRPVDQLSGGERQRVVVARALAQEASVLLLDEPTTALDLGRQQDVLELIDRLRRDRGLTVVSTLHDVGVAGQYSDHLMLLVEGRVQAAGTPGEVLQPDRLSAVYGAEVAVVDDGDGWVVIPRRPRRHPLDGLPPGAKG